jgi:hypothetical protein
MAMNPKIANATAYAFIIILQWLWTLSDNKGWVAVYNVALTLNLLCLMAVSLSSGPRHGRVDQFTSMGICLISLVMCLSGLIMVLFHQSYSYHFMITSIVSLLAGFSVFGLA